jgi:adenylate kinase
MDLVLLGAPGSGKGTQAAFLEAELHVKHIASGDLFRENLRNRTPLGLRAEAYMTKGALVPDEVTIAMLRERLGRPDAEGGVLLDGFPRTMEQAIALSEMMETLKRQVVGVLYVDVPDDHVVERLSGRFICRECQAPFHKNSNPFRLCPLRKCTGEHLYQRGDDTPETVRARLATFHRQSEPVIDYYRLLNLLATVPAHGPVEEVTRATLDAARALARRS